MISRSGHPARAPTGSSRPAGASPGSRRPGRSNTAADLKEAFTVAGFGWASSHTLRKTTATLPDRGGLTAREIADQLGHANPSMTQDRYLGRAVASKASSVLEALD